MKNVKWVLLTVFALLLTIGICRYCRAAVLSGTCPMNVSIIGGNPGSKKVDYFRFSQNMRRDIPLKFKVTNQSRNSACRINVSAASAKTSSQLALYYPADNPSSWISGQPLHFTLNPKQSRMVDLKLNLNRNFRTALQGQRLWGINVTEEAPPAHGETGVMNHFSYTIPVQVKNGKQPEPKLSCSTAFRSNQVFFYLKNPTGAFINHVTSSLKVANQDSGKVIYSREIKDGQIAPKSLFNISGILSNNLLPGRYVARLKVNVNDPNGSGEHHWEFSQKFQITIGSYITKSSQFQLWLIIIALIILTAVSGILGWKVYRNKK